MRSFYDSLLTSQSTIDRRPLDDEVNMTEKSLLVIEADSHLRDTLGIIFKQAGYLITTAGHATEAIQYLHDIAFDLVLFDINLPYDETAYLFSALPSLCKTNLPFLILTEFPSLDLSGQFSSQMTCHYFIKPVDPVQILSCVKDLLHEPLQ
jgi:two-component system, response regulator FlrC